MSKKQPEDLSQSTDLAAAGSNAVALTNSMFEADKGAGMEGIDKDSVALPFVLILQKGSPQVDETHAKADIVEGAKAGSIYDNISREVIDGKTGVVIVPCAFRRVFVRWGSDDSGEGFKGELTVEEVDALRAAGKIVELENRLYFPLEDGTVHEKKCDRVSDTRNHYVLVLGEDGGWKEALLSLTSTQIKKSKMLMSALAGVKLNGANGKFTPPTYANRVRMTTVPESNDKGSWYGVRFVLEGQVTDPQIYEAARNLNKNVAKGRVQAKYEEPHSADAGAAAGQEGGF